MKYFFVFLIFCILTACINSGEKEAQDWNKKFNDCVEIQIYTKRMDDRQAEDYCEKYTK